MRRVYFRCFRRKEVLIDGAGALVDDLAEVRDCAVCVVRSLTTARGWKTGALGSCASTTTAAMSFSSFRLLRARQNETGSPGRVTHITTRKQSRLPADAGREDLGRR